MVHAFAKKEITAKKEKKKEKGGFLFYQRAPFSFLQQARSVDECQRICPMGPAVCRSAPDSGRREPC